MNYKVLYVEDEPFLAGIVSDGLQRSGYSVSTVSDAKLALEEYRTMQPDICVLDIMLPYRDGYEIAGSIRADNPRLPIIFLSAKTLTEDVIKGFKSGGNDYLKKPFSMDELLVRMEALLNRFAANGTAAISETSTVYHFGGCRLDTLRQKLNTSDAEHALSYKETALLEMMILHKNSILERQTVLHKIWGEDSYYNTRSMDVFMTHLRKLLKNEPGIQIMNIRGIGYKFLSP
jgi:DNA-binding response OmpR family regulator